MTVAQGTLQDNIKNATRETAVLGETEVAVQFTGPFSPPADADAFTVEYPDAVTEVYKFRNGGIAGTVLRTVTLTYTDSTKDALDNGVVS